MTLACALAALFLFATLFLRTSEKSARGAPPTTLERADNGLLGAATWLRNEGVRILSLRERFSALRGQRGLARSGNLLIVSLPAVTGYRADEAAALEEWIRSGNTLLVLAALRDRPAWAQLPFVMRNDLQLLTGLSLAPERATAEVAARRHAGASAGSGAEEPPQRAPNERRRRADELARIMRLATELERPQLRSLAPNRAHSYFTGVARAVAYSDYVPFDNAVAIPRDGFALALAHDTGGGADAFWMRAHGAGTILVSGFASLFSNRALGAADNARLLANLVAANVAADGTVVFDDEHQGLSAAYDAAKFYSDPRLYATIAVIAAVWFTWVLGGTRLRMPLTRASAPREAELVRTTGLFLARVLRPEAAARRMLEHYLLRVGGIAGRSPMDVPHLWEWLENHPRLARADVLQLREWHTAASASQRVPLMRLHNLIVRTERQLAA